MIIFYDALKQRREMPIFNDHGADLSVVQTQYLALRFPKSDGLGLHTIQNLLHRRMDMLVQHYFADVPK
jgi:hypothetical protein